MEQNALAKIVGCCYISVLPYTVCFAHNLIHGLPWFKNGRLGVKTLAEGFQNTPNSHRVFLKVT